MYGFSALKDKVDTYLTSEQVGVISKAYEFAESAHTGQTRKSGEPYITHPLAAASLLADLHMDHETISAAIMHDVIEDCDITKEEMEAEFGVAITELVDGVTKITTAEFSTKAERTAQTIRKTLLAMAEDIRVILIKLADRTHNMQTLGAMSPESKRRKARETLEIYAPIAHRLGMFQIRNELEDLSFAALYPMRARVLRRAVKTMQKNNREIIEKIQNQIQEELQNEGIDAQVLGREKHLWSIYQKMSNDKKSFDEVLDIFGFRIVVTDVKTCYTTLGILHNLYKPIPGRFKDYIALPRANGYQSLHSTLSIERGLPIEVQVRTQEMDRLANTGIAAHWTYKLEDATSQQRRAREWVRDVLELQQRAGNSQEFLEHVKNDLFPDEVNVFSPSGDIFILPKFSTPIDFAYAVHSDIGNQCVGAFVDGKPVPLNKRLRSGQKVKIVTSAFGRPDTRWLDFVVSSRARSSIRQYLKQQEQSDALETGQRLLEEALKKYGLSLDVIDDETIANRFPDVNGGLESLCKDIGLGLRQPIVTALQLSNTEIHDDAEKQRLQIHGTENLLMHYGKCCYPIPGDDITGHTSKERGMVVHRSECRNVLADIKKHNSHWIPLSWAENPDGHFVVGIDIFMRNQRGALAKAASIISDNYADIAHIETKLIHIGQSCISAEISIRDSKHLTKVKRRLEQLEEVSEIRRMTN